MSRQLVASLIAMTLCLAVSVAHGEPRRGGGGGGERSEGGRSAGERSSSGRSEGERSGSERAGGERGGGERSGGQATKSKKPPGGNWSEFNSEGNQGRREGGNERNASGAEGAAAGAAHSNRNSPQASGAEGAAAGAARSNRNQPQASGAEGAAGGAAMSNRNNPQYSGAEGAAAGAAAANRNQPTYSGAQGAAAGAAIANNNAPAASGAAGAAAGYAAVRNNVNHPGMYGQEWYGQHQNAWAPTGWAAGAAWTPATWSGVSSQVGYDIDTTPVSYNYGNNVTCVGGNVVVDGQPAGTAEQFSQEADTIADNGAAAATDPSDKWLPLGVFALVRNEQQHPQLIMQLAVNQDGVLRGNYTDEVTDTTSPVHGGVDKKTQRAAWTIGDNKYSVIEAGLKNLTDGEAPALLHKNGTTQRWLLVRLDQSGQNAAQ